MNRLNHIALLLLVLLSVSVVYGQEDSIPSILYAVRDDKNDKATIYAFNLADDIKSEVGIVHNVGGDAGWSPDGKRIYLFDFDSTNQRILTLINLETHDRQTLPDPLFGGQCTLPFWWSPSGNSLAYAANVDSQAVLKILNLLTGDIQVLANADLIYEMVSWSHDGRYLAYQAKSATPTLTARFEIWDTQQNRIAYATDIASIDEFPQWSPSENRIAFGSLDSAQDIVYNLTDETQHAYPAGRIQNWSPDGRFLTLYSRGDDEKHLLSIIDVVAGAKLELASEISTADVDYDAAWSFDGRYLALATVDHADDYKRTVYVVDTLDRSSRRLIPTSLIQSHFVWSPVDHTLAFATYPQLMDGGNPFTSLWVFNMDDPKPHEFPVEISQYYFRRTLSWSADGRYMMVVTTTGILLLDKQSGQLNPIARTIPQVPSAYWLPDGLQLALASFSSSDIYVFTPESGALKNITNTPNEHEEFLGWQGTKHNESLIFCGEG